MPGSSSSACTTASLSAGSPRQIQLSSLLSMASSLVAAFGQCFHNIPRSLTMHAALDWPSSDCRWGPSRSSSSQARRSTGERLHSCSSARWCVKQISLHGQCGGKSGPSSSSTSVCTSPTNPGRGPSSDSTLQACDCNVLLRVCTGLWRRM